MNVIILQLKLVCLGFFVCFADVHAPDAFTVGICPLLALGFGSCVNEGFSLLLYESLCIPAIILHSPTFCACCELIFFLHVDDTVCAITQDVLLSDSDVSSFTKGCVLRSCLLFSVLYYIDYSLLYHDQAVVNSGVLFPSLWICNSILKLAFIF